MTSVKRCREQEDIHEPRRSPSVSSTDTNSSRRSSSVSSHSSRASSIGNHAPEPGITSESHSFRRIFVCPASKSPISHLLELATPRKDRTPLRALNSVTFTPARRLEHRTSIDVFSVDVHVESLLGPLSARGMGSSKQSAKTAAARAALDALFRGELHTSLDPFVPSVPLDIACIALSSKHARQMEENKEHLKILRQLRDASLQINTEAVHVWCVDVEAYELAQTRPAPLLEVGVTWVTTTNPSGSGVNEIKSRHFVVRENLALRNGKYCPDRKDHHNFGPSEVISERDLAGIVRTYLQDMALSGRIAALVGHTIDSDIKWLDSLGVAVRLDGNAVCDVGKAYAAHQGLPQVVSLEKMLRELDIDYTNLHNAGNDARYTIEVLLRLMGLV